MIGYGEASVTYSNESKSYWEYKLPSNALVFNRTEFANEDHTYDLSSWEPQVNPLKILMR